MFHVFGMSSILNVCMRFGCTLSLVPRVDAGAALEAIERDRVTLFEGVPTMFISVLEHPELDRYDTSRPGSWTRSSSASASLFWRATA